MTNLKKMLFQKYMSEGRDLLINKLKKTYDPKKGDRFHKDGITYEISQVEVVNDTIEFEISSKIPLEELNGKEDITNFFESVKKICFEHKKAPKHASMDDIIHKLGGKEIKKRDYVRLWYNYNFNELYDEEKIQQEAESIINGESSREIPEIPGVITIAARLVLLSIKEKVQIYIKDNIDRLIEANEQVRAQYNKA